MSDAEKAALLDRIVAAWTDPGRYPGWHYRMKRDVKHQMPILGQLLDRAAREQ